MKISIVIPVLNQVQYLEECILSVINQNFVNKELIIIDGGSTDGTLEIIDKYKDHIHYFISRKDKHIYEAIQAGFEQSTGDIMAWLGSDDKYHDGCFSIVAEIFKHFSEVKWLVGATVAYDEHGRSVYVKESLPVHILQFIHRVNPMIQQESVFWHRSLWEKAGSTVLRGYSYAGEQALWAEFFRFEKLFIVNALLGGFRHREGQTSKARSEQYEKEYSNIRVGLINRYPYLKNKSRILFLVKKYFIKFSLVKKDRIPAFFNRFFKRWFIVRSKIEYDLNDKVFKTQ